MFPAPLLEVLDDQIESLVADVNTDSADVAMPTPEIEPAWRRLIFGPEPAVSSMIFVPKTSDTTAEQVLEHYRNYVTWIGETEIAAAGDAIDEETAKAVRGAYGAIAGVEQGWKLEVEETDRLRTVDHHLASLAIVIAEYYQKPVVQRSAELSRLIRKRLDADAHGFTNAILTDYLVNGLHDAGERISETKASAAAFSIAEAYEDVARDALLKEADGETARWPHAIRHLTYSIDRIFSVMGTLSSGHYLQLMLSKHDQDPSLDVYPILYLAAEHHYAIGWAKRGTGFASEVPEDAWPILREQTAIASRYMRAAYRHSPSNPYAPTKLVHYSLTDSTAGVSDKTWFNLVLQAQRDFTPVYRVYANSLRPRWGGSTYDLLELANVLIDIDMFTTTEQTSWAAFECLKHVRDSCDGDAFRLVAIPGYVRTLSRLATVLAERAAEGESERIHSRGHWRDLKDWTLQVGLVDKYRRLLATEDSACDVTCAPVHHALIASIEDPAGSDVMTLFSAFAPETAPKLTATSTAELRACATKAREQGEHESIAPFLDQHEKLVTLAEQYFSGTWATLDLLDSEQAGVISVGNPDLDLRKDRSVTLKSYKNKTPHAVFCGMPLPLPMLIDVEINPARFIRGFVHEPLGIFVGFDRRIMVDDPGRMWFIDSKEEFARLAVMPVGEQFLPSDDSIPIEKSDWYRLSLYVSRDETRGYLNGVDLAVDKTPFEDECIPVWVGPTNFFRGYRELDVRNFRLRYCPDGRIPSGTFDASDGKRSPVREEIKASPNP